MKSTKLANRYANALYMFAIEKDKLETVYKDILLLQGVFAENRDLRAVIESPVITPDKKSNVFTELFKNKIDEVSFGFLNLVLIKKRAPAFQCIFEEFVKFYYMHHNIKKAQITTAVALNEKLLAEIQTLLEGQTKSSIEIEQIIKPDIIGGFIIKIEDFLIDASLRGKINKLKMEFANNIYQASF